MTAIDRAIDVITRHHPSGNLIREDMQHLADAGLLVTDELIDLVDWLVDDDDCWFDHHGGCQAHGILSLQPGEVCPHQAAKDWLAMQHKDTP